LYDDVTLWHSPESPQRVRKSRDRVGWQVLSANNTVQYVAWFKCLMLVTRTPPGRRQTNLSSRQLFWITAMHYRIILVYSNEHESIFVIEVD